MYTYNKAQVSDQLKTIGGDFQIASGKAKEDSRMKKSLEKQKEEYEKLRRKILSEIYDL